MICTSVIIIHPVNDKIKQHNRMVYSAQSQRHVSEQIEALHWNRVTAAEDIAELDTVAVRRDADLAETAVVGTLPEEYGDLHLHPDHRPDDQEATEYKEMRKRLLELSEKRDGLRQKVAQYQHLRTLLEPLNDPQANIQPNLVTRDGELSQELDRMRVLLARVTGRVSEIERPAAAPETAQNSTKPTTNEQKLEHLMELT